MSRWILIALLIILLGLVITGGIYYSFSKPTEVLQKRPIIKNEISLGQPSELAENFNPVKYTPKFKILEVNLISNTLNLEFLFPKTRVGEIVNSLITCNQIILNGGFISIDELNEKINSSKNDPALFSGLCTDLSCREINKLCELVISQ